ncbi:MAG: hypothetical protein FWE59_02430 [Oscillospiraceae bacterium]|nr:hypothetical protein [Oscillospiraceae bacterium]
MKQGMKRILRFAVLMILAGAVATAGATAADKATAATAADTAAATATTPGTVPIGVADTADTAATDVPDGARNIYVGDIITLEITSEDFSDFSDISAAALAEAFEDFEIVELTESPEGFLLSLRTFVPGTYTARLGNKEIVIDVKSTLDDLDREGIFEGGTHVAPPGFSFPWRILFYVAAGILAASGGFILVGIVKKKRAKAPSPYHVFLRRSGELDAGADNYLVDLTLYFKEYLESLYQFRIIGKTSFEILAELVGIEALSPMLPEIGSWLTEGDRLKFTGVDVAPEEQQAHYKRLLTLVGGIDALEAGAA